MNIFWVNNVAGCDVPQSRGDVEWLARQGIGAILSLTEEPLAPDWVKDFVTLHIPVRDFTAPSAAQFNLCVDFLKDCALEDKTPVVHCTMGYGRTGTVLAAHLIANGTSAREAIEEVRRLRPGAIETGEQETALYRYEEQCNAGR